MQRLVLAMAICCWLCTGSAAQQTQCGGLPDAPSASAHTQAAPPRGTKPLKSGADFVQLLQRKSLVFPDLATNQGPLSARQKFELAANNSVALSTIGKVLIGSAYGQAVDHPEGYGQGGAGYGKRFGSGMARSASANLFGTFLIASVLHEDPRFFVEKNLSFQQSLKYSATRLVIARSDTGKPMANFAGVLGPLAGEALANTYYPERNRGAGPTLIRYASDMGWKFGGNVLRQYWPTINKKLRLAPLVDEPAATPNQPR
jgi:hypothetical protein